MRGSEAEFAAESGHKIGGFDWAFDDEVLTDAGAECEQPGGAGESVAGAVVLKAVAAGAFIGIAAEIGEDEERGFSGVFGEGINELPDIGAEPVGALDGFEIKRVTAGVRDVDVVQGDPQEAGGEALHEMARDVDRQLVGAGEGAGMRAEFRKGQLKKLGHLVQVDFVAGERRGVERRFVVIAKQMVVEIGASGGERAGEQAFGQDNAGT